MVIYVDVLIILNIYVNYFLLRGTSRLTGIPLKAPRCIAAAAVGSLFSLVVLLPPMNALLTLLIKLPAAAVTVAAAYGFSELRRYFRLMLAFFAVNFIFAGLTLAVYTFLQPSFMAYNNSVFYIDFSLLTLVAATTASYTVICIASRLRTKQLPSDGSYTLELRHNNSAVAVAALADTGNSLTDVFSGKPVIICPVRTLEKLLPREIIGKLPSYPESGEHISGFRLIPYTTISSAGLLPVFTPDSAVIRCVSDSGSKRCPVDVLIGINTCRDVAGAIFNPRIIT